MKTKQPIPSYIRKPLTILSLIIIIPIGMIDGAIKITKEWFKLCWSGWID